MRNTISRKLDIDQNVSDSIKKKNCLPWFYMLLHIKLEHDCNFFLSKVMPGLFNFARTKIIRVHDHTQTK